MEDYTIYVDGNEWKISKAPSIELACELAHVKLGPLSPIDVVEIWDGNKVVAHLCEDGQTIILTDEQKNFIGTYYDQNKVELPNNGIELKRK